jgi:hypothetical protein
MSSENQIVIPFGKFKGTPIEEFINPSNIKALNYMNWAQNAEPGLYQTLKDLINKHQTQTINLYFPTVNTNASPTPEHNKLQNMFLKQEVCEKLFSLFSYEKDFEKLTETFKDDDNYKYFETVILNEKKKIEDIMKSIQFEYKFNWDVYIPDETSINEIIFKSKKELEIENINKIKEECIEELKIEKEELGNKIKKYNDLYNVEIIKYNEEMNLYKIKVGENIETLQEYNIKLEKSKEEFQNKLLSICCLTGKKHSKFSNSKILCSDAEKLLEEYIINYEKTLHKPPKEINTSEWTSNFSKKEIYEKDLKKYERDYESNLNKIMDKKIDKYFENRKEFYTDKFKEIKYDNNKFKKAYYCGSKFNKEKDSIKIGEISNIFYHHNYYIEIKTSVGDDYPDILRKMRNQMEQTKLYVQKNNIEGSNVFILLIKTFNSVSTSKEDLLKIFNQAGIYVLFIDKIFNNEKSLNTESSKFLIEDSVLENENTILKEKLLDKEKELDKLNNENTILKEKLLDKEKELDKLKKENDILLMGKLSLKEEDKEDDIKLSFEDLNKIDVSDLNEKLHLLSQNHLATLKKERKSKKKDNTIGLSFKF